MQQIELTLYDPNFFAMIIFIFVLIESDFYLTLVGYSLYKKYYAEYVTFESYELNPLWRKTIEKGKKFNIKHLAIGLLMILFVSLLKQVHQDGFILVTGMIIFPYLIINMLHLQNIMLFRYLKIRREDIQGHIKESLPFETMKMLLVLVSYTLILLFIFILEQSIFLLGGVLGTGVITLSVYRIYRKEVKKKQPLRNDKEEYDILAI